jgi:rubredoxin
VSAGETDSSRPPQVGAKYSGVRLRCNKCGVVKLTMDQLRRLSLCRPDSRQCPECGAMAQFV